VLSRGPLVVIGDPPYDAERTRSGRSSNRAYTANNT
jgi:hypothetical protein